MEWSQASSTSIGASSGPSPSAECTLLTHVLGPTCSHRGKSSEELRSADRTEACAMSTSTARSPFPPIDRTAQLLLRSLLFPLSGGCSLAPQVYAAGEDDHEVFEVGNAVVVHDSETCARRVVKEAHLFHEIAEQRCFRS